MKDVCEKLNVLITGTASGIGRATAVYFLERGHHVWGFDVEGSSIEDPEYEHFLVDVRCPEQFPEGLKPAVIVNNAGVQNSGDDIGVNLMGTIRVTEKYAFHNENIRSVVNMGSASGITGSEFPEYAASKGGIQSYTKNVAQRLAPQAICNSVNPGGVLTELNRPVMEDKNLWNQIMDLTPLKRWAEPEEIAEWIYFLAVNNRFMTGQNLLIDGGEAGDMHFIWPED